METLTTIDTARRLLRSHGIDDAQLAEQAMLLRRQWEAAQAEAEHAIAEQNGDDVEPMAPETVWLLGSVLQLQRQWGGRCISCRHWDTSPMNDGTPYGYCPRVVDRETDTLVKAGRVSIETFAPFGCICWEEIPADDPETLRARTEIAMAIGLLPQMPEGE